MIGASFKSCKWLIGKECPGADNVKQIVIRIKDKGKARILAELLASLDFVAAVQTSEIKDWDAETTSSEETVDLGSLAETWADGSVDANDFRRPKPLDELLEAQEPPRITDINDLAIRFWPQDESVDDLIEYIYAQRQEDRLEH